MSRSKPIKPRHIGGLATLFWGWQCDLIWFALPIAIILETRYYLNRRWALTKTDFYRVADLTAIGLVAMVVFLFLNRQEYHFITTLLLPVFIAASGIITVATYASLRGGGSLNGDGLIMFSVGFCAAVLGLAIRGLTKPSSAKEIS